MLLSFFFEVMIFSAVKRNIWSYYFTLCKAEYVATSLLTTLKSKTSIKGGGGGGREGEERTGRGKGEGGTTVQVIIDAAKWGIVVFTKWENKFSL